MGSLHAGNGYLANVAPSDFSAMFEQELPVSMSGKEWLATYDEHWDNATQVTCPDNLVGDIDSC